MAQRRYGMSLDGSVHQRLTVQFRYYVFVDPLPQAVIASDARMKWYIAHTANFCNRTLDSTEY